MLALPGLFRRVRGKAAEQHQVRVLREEREEVRKEDAVKRARREPVHIEPPPAPVIEKSDRAKREQQIPLFHGTGGDESGIPPLSLLDDPCLLYTSRCV